MGCDIHLVVEEQADSGSWVAINTFQSHNMAPWRRQGKNVTSIDLWSSPVARDRNYDRFAALAGVRGDGPKPKGLPNDVSDTTKFLVDKWGVDGHSHSWLPLTEATKIWMKTEYSDFLKDDKLYTNYPEYHYFGVEQLTEDPKEFDKYRVVFWFDN